MEFIVGFGSSFLRHYHRAWSESQSSVSLVVEDGAGRIVGVLLGSLDPAAHIAGMVRRRGFGLAARMALGAVLRPRLAGQLVRSRLGRYVRGVWRVAGPRAVAPDPVESRSSDTARRGAADSGQVGSVSTGEITHLFVDPSHSGRGVGRALVEEAVARGRKAGLGEMVLVTPPDMPARQFYERLGWKESGEVTSRSGEHFIRYTMTLD